MWVLAPLPGNASQSSSQQQTIYLTSGEISIGRPLKKGSTVGKADILIFNEQSVSTIHAKLQVDEASQQHHGFSHGSISITDISRFGTFLTRGSTVDQRLPKAAEQLQDGDVLKFGSNTRLRIQQLSVVLVASDGGQASNHQLQQQAAALNCQLHSTWPAAAAAAQEAYCIVQPDEVLSPSVLRALTDGYPLVTAAWLEAVAAKRAWAGKLPSVEQHLPKRLLLPAQQKQQDGDLQQLVLSDWTAAGEDLLAGYLLVFDGGCQDDLAAVAAACGAQQVMLGNQRRAPTLPALQQQAAQQTQTAVLIQPPQWPPQQQQQQQEEAGVSEHMACLREMQLLLAIARKDTGPLQQAVEAFQQQQQQQEGVAAAAAAAAAADQGDETEADATEEGEDEQQHADPAAAAGGPADATPAAAAAAAIGGVPVPRAGLLAVTPPVSQRPAVSTAGLTQADGWHSLGPSSSAAAPSRIQGVTQGRSTGSKRIAAASAAAGADAAAMPNSKRRKTADKTSPIKSPLPLKSKTQPQSQPRQQQQQPPSDAGFFGAKNATHGAQGSAAAQQQEDGEGLGYNTEVIVPLCVTDHLPPPVTVAQGEGAEVPNYKAFRRREDWQGDQQQQQQVVAIDLVAVDAPHLQGPDTDTFLRDEKHRQDRLRKADELFHANLKAVKAPPAAKPAARGKRK